MKNSGEYAEVQLVTQRVGGAQKSLTKTLASSLYTISSANDLDGLQACCNETTTTAYGGIQEADLVAADGSTPWEGKMSSTSTTISLNWIRTGATAAKVRDGKGGKPDLLVTTETNWNVIADLLQAQQRFTDGKETVKAGFTGLVFEGKEIFPDDYCPDDYAFFLNTMHIGFAIHKEGFNARTKWKVIPDSPEDKTMKIYWDGNLIVNNRKAHQGYSSVS